MTKRLIEQPDVLQMFYKTEKVIRVWMTFSFVNTCISSICSLEQNRTAIKSLGNFYSIFCP
jgi:hypothetical protein